MNKSISIFLIGFLLVSLVSFTFVYAEGSSTTSASSTSSASNIREQNKINSSNSSQIRERIQENMQVKFRNKTSEQCENFNLTKDRINCRLDNKIENTGIPETCKTLNVTNRGACIAFYSKVRVCYEKQGIQRDFCFKRVAGFASARVQAEQNQTAIRNYMVSLLYDLQERIENSVEQGTIDSESGAELIELIVQVKTAILEGKRRSEIVPILNEFKQKYREQMQNENNSSNNGGNETGNETE